LYGSQEECVPRQNRVTPFGEIVAVPERGTLMGNRGLLHDEHGRIKRPWQLKRWLVCVLEFRGRKRTVMTPGRYTELFFLDEATALAAGHRPCAECRRARYAVFCEAWVTGNRVAKSARLTAGAIDEQLHAERIAADRSKRDYVSILHELPDGVFVKTAASGDRACLLWNRLLLEWTPGGYRESWRVRKGEKVTVLTPPSTVAAVRAGYLPEVHESAKR
jgi:hypothetical protein